MHLPRHVFLEFPFDTTRTGDNVHKRQWAKSVLAFAATLCALTSTAQNFPTRPLKIIIGQAPGGAVDTVARTLADRLSALMGQPVIVDARPGAAGMLAAELVARAAPDGYTLGLLDAGSLAVSPVLQKKVNYDVTKDFTYVGLVAKIPLVLVAHPQLPVSTIADLTQHLRQHPDKVSYASSGVGGPLHLAMEAYKQKAGVNATHIPYKGGAPGLADVVSGHVPLMFIDTNLGNQYAASGRVKALAVATAERNSKLPQVPTFSESGLKGFDFAPWVGIVAPAGLQRDVAAMLENALQEVSGNADMVAKVQSLGFVPLKSTSAQFSTFATKELAYYRQLIQEQKIQVEE